MKKKLKLKYNIIKNFQINLLYNHIIGNIKLSNRFFYIRNNVYSGYGGYAGLCHIGYGCYIFPIHGPGRVITKTVEYIFKTNTKFLEKYKKYITLHKFKYVI